ncbi:MAG: DUF2490 domain-containing protein [Bacteroidota bacterium]
MSIWFMMVMQPLGAQQSKNSPGTWMVFALDNPLSEKWRIPIVGILCNENLATQTEFGFIRTGLSYQTNPSLKLTLGAAYVDSQPFYHHEFDRLTTQVWLYEQATLCSGKKWRHRMRLEHRWISKPDSKIFNMRFRYRLAFKQQLTKNLYLKCTDEPFFNLSTGRLDQNRLFLGLGKRMCKDLSFEVGYFKTHVQGRSFDRIRVAIHLKTLLFRKSMETTNASKYINTPK